MLRSTTAAIALVAALFATSLSAQTFLNEDWSTAAGQTPPAGWSSKVQGPTPAPWRFDNPGGRTITAPFLGTFAISDPDNAFSVGGTAQSTLRSPAFNATGATLLNLSFDQHFRDLSSGWSIDVFDGSTWNTVASQANNSVNADIGYPTTVPVGTMYDVTAAAAASAQAQLRFHYTYGYDWWWAVDNVKIEQPSPIDMALVSIDGPVESPTACLPATGLQTVTITVRNEGALIVTNGSLIQVDFSVNAGPVTTEFIILAADLNPNTSLQYTFATQANLPAPGPNTLACTVTLFGDGDPTDDTKSQVYGAGGGMPLMSLPYVENFDGSAGNFSVIPPTGWQQDANDATGFDIDWYMYSGTTGSFNTGPQSDHTTGSGFYAYMEDDAEHAQVNLLTPCFDLSTSVAPQMSFWMHSWNNNVPATTFENFLSIDVISYPGGVVTMDALGPIGHQATGANWSLTTWTQQMVNLSAFAGQVVQLRFRGRSDNTWFAHDIGIDDVAVYDPAPTPGQAPRAGLGSFNINNATNINTAAVSSGLGGPYYASVSQGANFTMSFDGAPGQPITVVYGALNPVSASYPGGIGQFDIGGPGVDGMGIPLNIAVFVNAIGWAQAGFPGFPIDALFFTGAAGQVSITFVLPNFGIPLGSPLTTFQSAISAPAAPFVYITNAVHTTVN